MTMLQSSDLQCLVFVLCLVSTTVTGFALKLGPCCNPATQMTDFDINKYMGTWHLQKLMTGASFLARLGKCYKQELTKDTQKPDEISITNSLLFGSYFKYEVSGYARLADGPKGMLEVNLNIPVLGWRSAQLQVLSTDYQTYAIAVTCQEYPALNGYFHTQSGFVLSRSTSTDDKFTEIIMNKLTEFDLAPSDFIQIDQSGCAN